MRKGKRLKARGKNDKRRGTVLRKNGKVYRDRVCTVCGKDHWHGENMCITCRNEQQKKRRGNTYVKRKATQWEKDRQKRLAAHAERIEREIIAIEAAGFHEVRVIDEAAFPIECMVNDPTANAIIEDLKIPTGEEEEIKSSFASIKVYGVKPNETA